MSVLDKEFGLEEYRGELLSIKDRLKNAENYEDPGQVLRLNIERAERLLDRIEQESDTRFSPRLMEVAANLINTITTATNSIIQNQVSLDTTNQKQEFLDLKKLEFDLKKQKESTKKIPPGNYKQQNIYLSDRETILKMMKEKREEE